MSKTIVCGCEDVSAEDFEAAFAHGYADIESVKRYTGFGTGVCQGKTCLAAASRLIRERTGVSPAPFTPRPPTRHVSLAQLASVDPEPGGHAEIPGLPEAEPRPPEKVPPLREHADIVIVGGGIQGLSIAYNLAQRGITDVVVLERSYLCSGASGRNGGGIRTQWSTPTNIELSKRSLEICRRFARDLGINVWFRQGGYLFVTANAEDAKRMERNAVVQRRLGVPTEVLTPAAARRIVPELDDTKFICAAYNPEDGVMFPWPFLWGYASGCKKLGVAVETFTAVTGFDIAAGRVRAVRTTRGPIACERVVNAAGAWSREVAALAEVRLPNQPYRHEISVTEPLKPFLQPMLSMLGTGLYFSQSMRGEIVGGMGDPKDKPGIDMTSSLRFLSRYSRGVLELLPGLGHVKITRQWAGCYDVTPDNAPILGETPGLPNFIQVNGFVGHGFMMAPAVAERTAAFLCGEKDELFARFNLSRFAEDRLEREDFIIG